MPATNRKQREFQRREQEILEGALALFNTADWQGITVEQIARHVEIGKGTIYKHFASKDEIYARLVMEYQRVAIEKLRRIDRSVDVIQQLRAIIQVVFEQHLAADEYRRLIQYASRDEFRGMLTPATRDALLAQDREYIALIEDVIAEGVRRAILPRKSAEDLLFGPMAAMLGARTMAWNQCMCPGPALTRESVNELTNFILAGMLYQEWLSEEELLDDAALAVALRAVTMAV